MKRFYYLATALIVLAGAAGCKKNADVQEPGLQPSGKMRTVTIQAGQGTTKTSVNNGKLTWTAGDELTIVPQLGSIEPASLDITGGAGTDNGTFTGVIDAAIEDNTPLYGYAGGDWSYSSGTFTVNMSAEQTYVSNGLAEDAYPSIGSGSIQNGITLSNPFGVLKLNVKGATTDLVKSITVTSTANNLAGSFTVVPGGSVSDGSSKTITLGSIPNVALSASGVAFYVVVPPAEYAANDLTIVIRDASNEIIFGNVNDATINVSANNATLMDVIRPYYGKCNASDYTQVTIGTQTWMAENYACRKYDTDAVNNELTVEFKAAYKDVSGNIVVPTSESKTNTPYYADASDKSKWKSTEYAGNLTDAQVAKLGYLYSWAAAVGVADGKKQKSELSDRQGICPNGWHIPTKDEWSTLANYLDDNDGNTDAGKYLKTESGWYTGTGYQPGEDSYLFSGLPADGANGSSISNVGRYAVLCSATPYGSDYAYYRALYHNTDILRTTNNYKNYGYSVRCVMD